MKGNKKNIYNHKGLYEDQESQKMMNLINAASEKYNREVKEKKKDNIKNCIATIVIILLSILFLFLFIKLLQYNDKITSDFINNCMEQGYSRNYCVGRS